MEDHIAWRLGMFMPLAFLMGLSLKLHPRLFPYLTQSGFDLFAGAGLHVGAAALTLLLFLQKSIAAPPTMTVPLPPAYDALRDDYMYGIGIGTTRDMKSVITGVFLPSWVSRELTLGEKSTSGVASFIPCACCGIGRLPRI